MNKLTTYKAVIIGTSAGGLFALADLFKNLPSDYSLPVIVVQHRSKDPKDLLEEVLQTRCEIKIKQADEKEKIKSGRVYIAPPDYHLLIERDHSFSLSADAAVRFSRPSIDVLFESAAEVYKSQLIAIVLTGANKDGAAGIKAVKMNGGLVIAQDPMEAQFPFMPQAAVETNKVDHVLKLDKISSFLLSLNEK